jgi:ferrous iron transport protein A
MKQTPHHIACSDLSSIAPGRRVRIEGVVAGNNLQGRLLAMGFIKEAEVRIIMNHGQGPLLVGLGDSRITIGRGMAKKILVR